MQSCHMWLHLLINIMNTTCTYFWEHLVQNLICIYWNKTCNAQKFQRKSKVIWPCIILCYASFLTCVHITVFSMPWLCNCLIFYIADWQGKQPYHSQKQVPYFPVDNAHPVFSLLANFFNRYRAPYVYRAPENTWNRTTGCGKARI
jgi:hypothetical protein